MLIKFNDERPIFIQIAQGIEDGIISGIFVEGSQIPSTTEISTTYKVNPATVLKGMNILVDEGVIYKKRGIGMFVSEDATRKLIEKRKDQFFEIYITELIGEANKLNLKKEDIIQMIERGFSL
ncbi:MAG TPA: GntR family transcriptional regulator [Epulopiscium sp.]|nr:GntR family transcriptional regulator [Candidatus Epulonipiscium sp.]